MIHKITMNSTNPRAKKAVMEITAGSSAFPEGYCDLIDSVNGFDLKATAEGLERVSRVH